MSKHTPGPHPSRLTKRTWGEWYLHKTKTENPPKVYCDGITVCTVDTSAPDEGEREANALLIAASPDLLIIAQQLDAWSKEPDTIDLFNLADAARAAIAKAQPTSAD